MTRPCPFQRSRGPDNRKFQAQAVPSGLGRSGTLHVPPDDDHAEEDSSGPDNEDCLCAFVAHIHVTPQRPNALPSRPHHSWCAAVTTRAPARHSRRREITDGTESPCGPHLAMSPTARAQGLESAATGTVAQAANLDRTAADEDEREAQVATTENGYGVCRPTPRCSMKAVRRARLTLAEGRCANFVQYFGSARHRHDRAVRGMRVRRDVRWGASGLLCNVVVGGDLTALGRDSLRCRRARTS